jgi:hypothetical protein
VFLIISRSFSDSSVLHIRLFILYDYTSKYVILMPVVMLFWKERCKKAKNREEVHFYYSAKNKGGVKW